MSRYVPPGAESTSETYIEWRFERGQWVIADIADEYYPSTVPLPDWCC